MSEIKCSLNRNTLLLLRRKNRPEMKVSVLFLLRRFVRSNLIYSLVKNKSVELPFVTKK